MNQKDTTDNNSNAQSSNKRAKSRHPYHNVTGPLDEPLKPHICNSTQSSCSSSIDASNADISIQNENKKRSASDLQYHDYGYGRHQHIPLTNLKELLDCKLGYCSTSNSLGW